MTRVKAAVLYEVGKPLVVEEIDLAAPREGEVQVRFVASGVCHSDYHRITGDRASPLPMVLGHEGAGVVEAVGSGVSHVKTGDTVIIAAAIACGRCRFCLAGSSNLCVRKTEPRHVMGDGTPRLSKDGQPIYHMFRISSYAQRAIVPGEQVVPVSSDVPLDKACLLACGVATGVCAVFNRAQVVPGSTVAVIGVGGVGLNAVQGAAIAGAHRIIAVDIKRPKLELALRLGATDLVDSSQEDAVARIRELTGGWGADYTFEAIGLPETMLQALEAVRRGGTAVLLGMAPFGSRLSIRPELLQEDRVLTGGSLGGCCPHTDIPMLVEMYMAGKLKLDELISHRWPLEDINQAFDLMHRGEGARSIIVY